MLLRPVLARAALALALLGAAPGTSVAAGEEAALIKIKTAYLYNFMKFVRWPESAGPNLQLCVVGDGALASYAMSALHGKQAGGRTVNVTASAVTDDQSACSMVYSGGNKAPATAPSALTVGEGPAFLDAGGMLAFSVVQDRVRFAVNLKAVRQAGLSVDAQLLSVALEVRQ